MIWVDRIAKQLENKTQHVDDMFTPSGFAHMGSLRGPILHDVVYKVLTLNNKKTVFTYVFNDFDTIDGLPPELKEKFSPYFAWPLKKAPSPVEGYPSFADYFAADFKKALESLAFQAQYLSSWDLYHAGKFNDVIKTALDNKEKILEIYKKVAGYKKKAADWYPLQVICQKCGKLGTTKVTDWDGKLVTFTCEPNLVTWAEGCGYKGTISPFDGNGKLPWKVDWPAHWKTLGVTFEGAGKDHASKGGSYDIAFALCDEVFHYPRPFYFTYEFFLFGGKKMASSKGIGLKARDLTGIIPPEVARFLIVRLQPEKTLEFNPHGDAVSNLFDDFDKCLNAYFARLENKIPEGKPGEVLSDFARIMELSSIKPLPKQRLLLPRFRTIVNLIKTKTDLPAFFAKQKGSQLNADETAMLEERIKYAKIYLENYAEIKTVSQDSSSHFHFTEVQKKSLKLLHDRMQILDAPARELIQETMFNVIKESQISPKEFFKAFYQTLTGKPFGPKAADLILEKGLKNTIEKFSKVH